MNINLSFRRNQHTLKFLSAILLILLGGYNAFAQDAQDKPKEHERKFALGYFAPEVIEFVKIFGYKSDDWLDDFAIEIKNKSDKPIYYMLLMLDALDADLNDRDVNHNDVMMTFLEFGNPDLSPTGMLPKDLEKDPHLNPGETITLTISAKDKEGYKIILARRLQDASLSTDQVAKLILHVSQIKYGDGTVDNPLTRKKPR